MVACTILQRWGGIAQKLWYSCWPCGAHWLCRASGCGLHTHGDDINKDAYDVGIAQMAHSKSLGLPLWSALFASASSSHDKQPLLHACFCLMLTYHGLSEISTGCQQNCCKADKHLSSKSSLCKQTCIICCIAQLLHRCLSLHHIPSLSANVSVPKVLLQNARLGSGASSSACFEVHGRRTSFPEQKAP